MVDFLKPAPGLRNIQIQILVISPGVTRLKFKNYEDMGDYYQGRLEEFEAKGTRIVTVGICMFVFEKPVKP